MIEFFGGATSSGIQSILRIGYKDQTIDLSEHNINFASYLNNKLYAIMTGPTSNPLVSRVD